MIAHIPSKADVVAVPSKPVKWADYVSVALILVGIGLRIYQWLLNRSLWRDECYLAVNIVERGFGELHKPLEYSQSAPYLFLVASKCMVSVFGTSELVLRFIPLTASILSLWVFWFLAKECLDRSVVPVAVAIFTFAYQPFYYAQELKQYTLDIFLTTLVAWLTAKIFKRPEAPSGLFLTLFFTGCVGIFAMHSMPFLLAGAGLAALWAKRRGILNLSYVWLFLAIGAWLLLFAANYFVVIEPNYTDPVMKKFWAFAYPGMPWSIAGLRSWFFLINRYLWYLGYANIFKVLIVGVLLCGAWSAFKDNHLIFLANTLTVCAYWIAALAGRAPFYDRLILFLFPFLALLIGKGLSLINSRKHWFIYALGVGAILVPTIAGIPKTIRLRESENYRDPIRCLGRLRKNAEPVYVQFWAQPGFRFYRRELGLSSLSLPPIVFGDQRREYRQAEREGDPPKRLTDIPRAIDELSALLRHKKIWVLTADTEECDNELLDKIYDSFGLTPSITYRATGTQLYYFDASSPRGVN